MTAISYHTTTSDDLMWARALVTPDLLASLDMLRADQADAGDFYRGDAAAVVRLAELVALTEAEVARRAWLANAGAPVRHPDAYESWRLLAEAVRESLAIADYCAAAGYPLRQAGRGELHGACPVCRDGHDRFMVWPSRGRWHCRRCGGHGDIINLYRSITGAGFCEALAVLADMAALPLPASLAVGAGR